MHSVKFLALSMLAGSGAAITANFDQSNINLSNYMSGNFTNFTVTANQYGSNGIVPNTQPNYLRATGQTATYGSALGSLYLNSHSTYGHLNSFYFACFTPLSAVPSGAPCNFTMTARCLDKNNNPNTFTLLTTYTADYHSMQLVDLTGFYQFYANMGYFNGNGAGARCYKYDFLAVPPQKGNNQFPAGFFFDTASYSVTTA